MLIFFPTKKGERDTHVYKEVYSANLVFNEKLGQYDIDFKTLKKR